MWGSVVAEPDDCEPDGCEQLSSLSGFGKKMSCRIFLLSVERGVESGVVESRGVVGSGLGGVK